MNNRMKNYVKEFDTLIFTCQYLEDDGEPIDITDISIKANMQSSSGSLIDTLDVKYLDNANGVFVLRPTMDRLPIGTHKIDILFEKENSRISSDTFNIIVKKAITPP